MQLKRATRNVICWLLAITLILLGYVKRAKRESFQEGVITSIHFHNPNKKLFRGMVDWLRENGYTFISCSELMEVLDKKIPCPQGAVWISLDDGWKENIENVIPIAVELDLPITIFICTSAIEDGVFWWERAKECAELFPTEYRGIETIRKLPGDVRHQILEIINQNKTNSTSGRNAMTIGDIRHISTFPQVTIGSHTVTHPFLSICTDFQIDYELRESKRKLEEWTGKPVRTFAYPSGDFDDRTKQCLKENRYELAATVIKNFATINSDCYLLPRTDVMDDGSLAENLCHALGVWEPTISKIKRIIRPRG
jgi:peptidoglycan/xylan/chitin deacetylase (PgdA/CDA1 family)